jgi:hypothetical protein
VCCASAGAERRGGVLCADPAYVVIPQGGEKKKQACVEQGGLLPPVFGRAQEPPLSSRWPLLIGTGYNCRRPLRSCTELPVLSQLEHGVRLRRPLLCCLQCWAGVVVGVGMDVGA